MNRSLSEKPQIALKADRTGTLVCRAGTGDCQYGVLAWYFIEPSHAIWATVAVLVATCPCALSLATPIALTVSTNRLASLGFWRRAGIPYYHTR